MSITKTSSNILNRTIGIAGCGEMGYPMLKMLLQNNINATGHDIKESNNFTDFGNKLKSELSLDKGILKRVKNLSNNENDLDNLFNEIRNN